MFKNFAVPKFFKRRGQVLVFYALMIPLLFLFAGVGIDLGWYYLNVSRLQNAADAAVIAGAYKLVEQDEFSNYFVKVLTQPPSDIMEYDKVKFNNEVKKLNMADGEAEAKRYSGKNLGHIVAGDSAKIFDDWNTSSNKDNHEVTLTAALYAKIADAQWEEKGIRYYSVTLEEKVTHLFLRNFEPMNAIVKAYVMLRPHDVDLITVIKELEDTNVIANWQYQKEYHDAEINWNHYRQTVNGKKAVSYVAGEYFRTETVNIEVQMGDGKNNGFNGTSNHSSGQKTDASLNKDGQKYYYGEYDKYGGVDSLNIDFNQDIATQFLTDWDLGASTDKKISYVKAAMDDWDETHGYDLRIQGLINFRDAWKNRNIMDEDTSNDLTPDPLWVRIESDPWWSGAKASYVGNATGWNSVRQMIISIDKTNTGDTTQAYNSASGNFDGYDIEGGKAYKYRPFFIFYKGPEVYEEGNDVRKSQPVILNLNADWNGILYAPNSPVVILGNGKKLTGFVIAKEFVQLKTVEDYTGNGYSEYQDLNGKPVLAKEAFDETALSEKYLEEDYVQKKSEDGNTIKVYELKKAPKHLIIDPRYVKGVEGATETAYVNALKKYRELTDAEIVQITFPEKDPLESLNNTQSYSVAFEDLLDKNELPTNEPDPDLSTSVNNKNSKYVPVMHNGVKKYIAKANLPYVRVYRNQSANEHYPYVPVCDLKIKTTASTENDYNGVTLADDDHNVYALKKVVAGLEAYKIDENTDTWKVPKASMTNAQSNYDSNANNTVEESEKDGCKYYKTSQITKVVDEEGYKYFVTKKEEDEAEKANKTPEKLNVVAEYQRTANDKFVNVAEGYYTYYDYQTNQDGIDVDKGNLKTVIRLVMDNKGNVQIKPLDEGSTEQITDSYKFQPDDQGWNKKTLNLETWEKNKDYRIPEYEVRYKKKEAFNLNEDSCYSYFQIPELHRKNYEYLNVDELNHIPADKWNVEDMFFTTRRANWID